MSKFTSGVDIDRLQTEDEVKRWVSLAFDQLQSLINGGLSFSDNFNAKILSITISTANVDVASLHGLGRVPSGYIVLGSSAATSVYDGASANTSSILYLRASVAATVKVLVI